MNTQLCTGCAVRALAAIPEIHVEAGDLGKVTRVYLGDDTVYTVRYVGGRVTYLPDELWQLEVVGDDSERVCL